MRKDNRFRFTLQWPADTQERTIAGDFLERLGNKKSDMIVAALWEYLQRHPETAVPGARIKITTQPMFSKEQILSEVKGMIRSYVEEVIPSMSAASSTEIADHAPAALDDDDLNMMLGNLDIFEQ